MFLREVKMKFYVDIGRKVLLIELIFEEGGLILIVNLLISFR